MNMIIREIIDKEEKESISKEVLYDLPEWFGMPESTQEYVDDAMDKPFLACFVEDKLAGYVVLNATSEDCADIFVIGIKKKFRQIGIGSILNEAYGTMARKLGYAYSQVKTIQMGHTTKNMILPIIFI